jgi:DEAD/DEAH box helicase domain-containing protein
VAAGYGADPVFVLASATMAQPEVLAERLVGRPVQPVTADGSPTGGLQLAVWRPPDLPTQGEQGAPVRRGVVAETAELLAALVGADVQALAFVRSRRAAEAVAAEAAEAVGETDPQARTRIAAYRGGFLPEERRELEKALRQRSLLGVATTSALELGVDLPGVDAVLVAGWPGTHASLRQQAGRAGRAGQESVAVFIARDEPLDSYFLAHPDALWDSRVETTVVDPNNPYVLAGHLLAAAAELPITDSDLPLFGPGTAELLDRLSAQGGLRRRDTGWFWTGRGRPVDSVDLRGSGQPIRVAEAETGRLLGTVDAGAADRTVHPGAVYVHQGAAFRVESLDQEDDVAIARPDASGESTTARVITDLRILRERQHARLGLADLVLGEVEVTSQVVSYLIRRADTGEVLGERPLDLPGRSLRTVAVWWTLPEELRQRALVDDAALAGAAHAAEHAAIGLLPLFATCDRWDIGGLSTAAHQDTGTATVFVHDGNPGGAGFAERGFHTARQWLQATAELVAGCRCQHGCPACVQSPKCGNGNEPLDKDAAAALLRALLASE